MTTEREGHRKRLKLAAAVLGAIAATALLGGFRKAPDPGPRLVKVGESIDLGPVRVKPLRAWLGTQCPLDYPSSAASTCVSFEAEVTNLTKASRTSVSDQIRLVEPAAPKDVFPVQELVRDRWILGGLQPNLPEVIVISWKLPSQSTPPSRITLALRSLQFKKRDNLLGGEGWFTPKEAARVELPLTEPDPAAMRVRNQ